MKLLNDLKTLAVKAASAIKDAACAAWRNTAALLQRLRQKTAEQVTVVQTAAANWWLASRPYIVTFAAIYALMILFAAGSMAYGFYVERTIPAVQSWLDALFNGHLRLPGWELMVARTGAPQTAAGAPVGASSID